MSASAKMSGSVWVPRAVKHVERAERAERAAAASAAEPAAAAEPSGPADGGWRGADDLDDLDAHNAKRQRGDGAAAEEPAIKAEASEARVASLEEEVIAGAPRLAQHIRSAAKCIKVAAMAYSLLEQGAVTPRSSGPFFLVVEAAMEEPMRPVVELKFRVAYRRLFEGLLRRKHAFSPEQQERLEAWQFQLSTSLELVQADDSFAFTRAAKKVRARRWGPSHRARR